MDALYLYMYYFFTSTSNSPPSRVLTVREAKSHAKLADILGPSAVQQALVQAQTPLPYAMGGPKKHDKLTTMLGETPPARTGSKGTLPGQEMMLCHVMSCHVM